MSEFVSVMDAMNSASYNDQKMIRDEVVEMEFVVPWTKVFPSMK